MLFVEEVSEVVWDVVVVWLFAGLQTSRRLDQDRLDLAAGELFSVSLGKPLLRQLDHDFAGMFPASMLANF